MKKIQLRIVLIHLLIIVVAFSSCKKTPDEQTVIHKADTSIMDNAIVNAQTSDSADNDKSDESAYILEHSAIENSCYAVRRLESQSYKWQANTASISQNRIDVFT